MLVDRDRHEPDSGRAGDRDRARVGRRFDQQRLPGADQRSQDGAERCLAAGGDRHVTRVEPWRRLLREPGCAARRARSRADASRRSAAVDARASAALSSLTGISESCRYPIANEIVSVAGGLGQRIDPTRVDRTVGERRGLPGEVERFARRRWFGDERSHPRAGDEQPLGGQRAQRAGDGDRADAMGLDQLPGRGQPLAGARPASSARSRSASISVLVSLAMREQSSATSTESIPLPAEIVTRRPSEVIRRPQVACSPSRATSGVRPPRPTSGSSRGPGSRRVRCAGSATRAVRSCSARRSSSTRTNPIRCARPISVRGEDPWRPLRPRWRSRTSCRRCRSGRSGCATGSSRARIRRRSCTSTCRPTSSSPTRRPARRARPG